MLKINDKHAGHRIIGAPFSGAYGTVFKATRISDNKEVALKLVPLSHGAENYSRFKQENQILHLLKPHTNVIEPYSNVRHDGTDAHYSMEFIEGDLNNLVARLYSSNLKEKLDLAIGIAKGLHHAHSKHVYHRDLHPANVRVDTDHGIIPKLSDFGLSKIIGAKPLSTAPLRVWGEGIQPPEVFFLSDDTPTEGFYRVGDIYALGIVIRWIFAASEVLYVLSVKASYYSYLTRNGFNPGDMNDYVNRTTPADRAQYFNNWLALVDPLSEQFLKIDLADVDMGKKLTELVQKMCHTDPTKRFQSVEPILIALESL